MHATLPNAHFPCFAARGLEALLGNYPRALRESIAFMRRTAQKKARGSPYAPLLLDAGPAAYLLWATNAPVHARSRASMLVMLE